MIPKLQILLAEIANRRRRQRFHAALSITWLLIIIVSFSLWHSGHSGGKFALCVVAALVTAPIILHFWSYLGLRDPHRIARTIEKEHPELQTAQLAAIEQNPDPKSGEFSYLQARLLMASLTASERDGWVDRISRPRLTILTGVNLVALFVFLIFACVFSIQKQEATAGSKYVAPETASRVLDIKVEPGDIEIERGTAITIQATFGGVIPSKSYVETKDSDGKTESIELLRPFTGPVYQARIEGVATDLEYKVTLPEGESATYKISVFDRPSLISSEAVLHFPAYLKKEPETHKDPRTIRTSEQTRMELTLVANVPGLTASLVAKKKEPIPLTPDPADGKRFHLSKILTESAIYRIVFTDEKNRTNSAGDILEIKLTPNKAPVVKVVLPMENDKVTPIQEVFLEARVTDDTELLASGMKYTLDGVEWTEVDAVSTDGKDGSQISHQIDLESAGAKPNDLIMWNAWAEDIAPDGNARRVNGDIHLVRVRNFDEEFYQRKMPPGDGPPPPPKLIKLQTDILNSTWAIRRDHAEISTDPPPAKDLETLVRSQEIAIEMASAMEAEQTDPAVRQIVTDARLEMQDALAQLKIAREKFSAPALDIAIGHQQAALRFLYQMMSNKNLIIEAEGGKPSESGPKEDLDLKKMEFPYKDEKQAKAEASEEAAEAMAILNRLAELAKRQRDLNEEMKALRMALNKAKTAAEKAEIERRLKQLRDQQKELLADVDELREKTADPDRKAARADQKKALDEAREKARQAKEDLDKEKLGDALAAGREAEEGLEKLHDDFRETSAAKLAIQLRELRNEARKLEANQKELTEGKGSEKSTPSLTESEKEKLDAKSQKRDFQKLVEGIKQTAETAERSEPLVSQDLVEALRQANHDGLGKALENMADATPYNRDPAAPAKATEGIKNLSREIENAAERILGNEKQALTYARDELRRLAEEAGALPVDSGKQGEEGKGESKKPGEGDKPGEGEGKEPGKGQGKKPGEGEGEKPGEGKGKGQGEGKEPGKGEGEGKGELPGKGKGEGQGEGEEPGEGEGKGQGKGMKPGEGEGQGEKPGKGKAQGQGEGEEPGDGKGEGKGEGEGNSTSESESSSAHRAGGTAITGGEYQEWSDRLYDIEAVIEDADAQTSVARARKASRELRKDFKRQSKAPDQETIEQEILRPLLEAAEKLDARLYELNREDPLAPVGRDPVPDRYEEIVRRYFEELGK